MKNRIFSLIVRSRILITPDFWRRVGRFCVVFPPSAYHSIVHFSSFFILLLVFLVGKLLFVLASVPIVGKLVLRAENWYGHHLGGRFDHLISRLERSRKSEIKRSYLISLGYKNLLVKKTRTLVTIFGMSVGIGVIVFLLSLGYGIERLIIGQVASLDELKIIDVTSGQNTALRLNSDVLARIEKIENVDAIMPTSSFVGRMIYKNARIDVLVYSASNRSLTLSRARLLKGKLFENNENYKAFLGKEVAGASDTATYAKFGEYVNDKIVSFNPLPDAPSYIWSSCSTSGKVVGLAPRVEGGLKGELVWGENYDWYFNSFSPVYDSQRKVYLAPWLRGDYPVYYETGDGKFIPKLDTFGRPEWQRGCIKQEDVQTIDQIGISGGRVLAATTSTASGSAVSSGVSSESLSSASPSATTLLFANAQVSTTSGGLEVVTLQSDSVTSRASQKKLTVDNSRSRSAIVSSALLNVFNIPLNKAIGTVFESSFILSKSQLPSIEGKMLTDDLTYKIIGVVEDDEVPFFYIPLSDIKELNINTFSQTKVIMKEKEHLAKARKQIEALGFRTTSTLDTVAQIESLFANLRVVLGLLGLVALAVAALGMFNTLTVSLLERTREIGGMKTMGMIAEEVQDLFLSEAMIMGLAGGVGGLFVGIMVGHIISLLVSVLALANGQGYLSLAYVPPFLSVFILVSSFLVGLLTGLYPARRAKRISALNALRYE